MDKAAYVFEKWALSPKTYLSAMAKRTSKINSLDLKRAKEGIRFEHYKKMSDNGFSHVSTGIKEQAARLLKMDATKAKYKNKLMRTRRLEGLKSRVDSVTPDTLPSESFIRTKPPGLRLSDI
jgi:hypothetical protein